MVNEPPVETARVTDSGDAKKAERAWDVFLDAHSELILRVARVVAHDHDSAMDCYTYVLDRLRENDSARLKAYTQDARCSFRTWLAVVVRRLCVDRYREKYGRRRGGDTRAQDAHRLRRRLADLVGVDAELERVRSEVDSAGELEHRELCEALESVLTGLGPRDRLLLTLRFEDDMPARQIAQVMSFPSPFHVYRHLKSVLAMCRDTLERKGFRAADG